MTIFDLNHPRFNSLPSESGERRLRRGRVASTAPWGELLLARRAAEAVEIDYVCHYYDIYIVYIYIQK